VDEKDEGRFSHFGIEIFNFIGGVIYFLGEKLVLFYVGKKVKKTGKQLESKNTRCSLKIFTLMHHCRNTYNNL